VSPDLALVVVIHDSAVELGRLLESLRRELAVAPQLVVVDTGSPDGGAELAREHGAEVVPLPDNPGFGAANNVGLGRVRAPLTALLNPDVVLLDDGLLALAERARAVDRLVVPGLRNPDGSRQRSAHPIPGTVGAFLPALLPGPVLPVRAEPWRARQPRTVGWAIAACLVARTGRLRTLGPFDPRIFLFHEDLDLCLRARAAGVATELHPAVVLRHDGGHSTVPAHGGEPHEAIARSRREVIARDLGAAALARDDAAQALTFATRIAGRRLLGRPAARERAQLHALGAARRGGAATVSGGWR
jgi:GT2 family glycosyltransferase